MQTTTVRPAQDRPLPHLVRPMALGDISQVMEVEQQSFPTMWPPTAFRREIQQNRLARYLVAGEGRGGPPTGGGGGGAYGEGGGAGRPPRARRGRAAADRRRRDGAAGGAGRRHA